LSEISTAAVGPRRPVDYAGRPIGPLRLARAMWLNILGGCCIMMTLGVLWPTSGITVVFLQEHIGATKTEIGLNLALVILGTTSALPGAWVFSRLRSRRRAWCAVTIAARSFCLGCALIALLAGGGQRQPAMIWAFILCLTIVQAGGVFASPAWWGWMADLIPQDIWGNFFGRRYRWLLLAQSLLGVGAGVALDLASPERMNLVYFSIFAVAALLAVVDPLLFLFVPEPVRPQPQARTAGMLLREYLEPLRNPAFRNTLLGAGLHGLFYNLPLVFLMLFLRGEQVGDVWIGGGAGLGLISLVTVVFAVSTGLASNLWGRLADRIGHRTVWVLSSLGYFSHVSYFFLNEHNVVWIALLNAAVYGIGFAGQPVAVQNLVLSMAPAPRREFYMSLYLAVTSIGAAAGPIAGGWLSDRYRVLPEILLPSGQPACYIHLLLAVAFAGMLATVPVMVRVPDPRGSAVGPWLGRLVSGDLLRLAWNMSVFDTDSSASRRVRALRRTGARDGNLMLPEITGALSDPDPRIRREALLALGRLGTPEAADMLRWYMFEPDPVVRAQLMEALGQAGLPDRGSLLRRALHDPDSRVRRAAVEALGRAGDRAAAADLRGMLAGEHDGEVLSSAAAALSRLGEFGAVREMLDLALRSENPTVRSQMLVALADLLGGTGTFAQLWRCDRNWRGRSFARLTHKLRRQARVLASSASGYAAHSRGDRRSLLAGLDAEIDAFLEAVQAEDWRTALETLDQAAFRIIRLRYRFEGDREHALEFLSALSPEQAERHWVLDVLNRTCRRGEAPEAPWDGLTLLALYALVHGQPP